jgi:hypothetical protein
LVIWLSGYLVIHYCRADRRFAATAGSARTITIESDKVALFGYFGVHPVLWLFGRSYNWLTDDQNDYEDANIQPNNQITK